jgi:zinc transporter ZupT
LCNSFKGDFAILLAAGMPFKMAIFCNFLSSLFIYIGIVIGIIVGENLNINMWIYAIAAGMFTYIAVCDMVVTFLF